MDQCKNCGTPLEMWTFDDIWSEVIRRYPQAVLLVSVDEGTPQEMMRTARHGSMYANIGMIDAARVMMLGSLGPVISELFDDDDDFLEDLEDER